MALGPKFKTGASTLKANRTLTDRETFIEAFDAFSSHRPCSFDSRYFGPVPASSIISTARPLWTEEKGTSYAQVGPVY